MDFKPLFDRLHQVGAHDGIRDEVICDLESLRFAAHLSKLSDLPDRVDLISQRITFLETLDRQSSLIRQINWELAKRREEGFVDLQYYRRLATTIIPYDDKMEKDIVDGLKELRELSCVH